MEKKINVAELLKNCPSGMELDCTMFIHPVTFDKVINYVNENYPIVIKTHNGSIMSFTKYGTYTDAMGDAKCVIFPKGKTTWKGFVPLLKFKDGDVVINKNDVGNWIGIFRNHCYDKYAFSCYCYLTRDGSFTNVSNTHDYFNTCLATEEEKQILFDAIKANGYKWNPETKTLEKLALNKFDITILKPFDKVLTRANDNDAWVCNLYSHKMKDYYVVLNAELAKQCIPYVGNERLLGTTNDCDEFYKTW